MRVSVISTALPSPSGSAEGRWLFGMLTGLVARGHEVTCLTCTGADPGSVTGSAALLADHAIRSAFVPLEPQERFALRKWHSLRRPYSEVARVPEIRRRLAELMPAPDVLHAEQLTTAWVLDRSDPAAIYVHSLPHLDWKDDSSVKGAFRRSQMRRSMASVTRLADVRSNCAASSPGVAGELTAARGGHVPVVPLTLDFSLYKPVPHPRRGSPTIGVIGSMHHRPSRLAAQRLVLDVLPLVRRGLPQVEVLIAGRQADTYCAHLAGPGVTICSTIADARDFFCSIDVMVYTPHCGTGVKVKVLEALAYGVPVVTDASGREGLEEMSLSNLPLAGTAAEAAARILEILSNPAHPTGGAAREELLVRYPLSRSITALEALYRGVTEQ